MAFYEIIQFNPQEKLTEFCKLSPDLYVKLAFYMMLIPVNTNISRNAVSAFF
jgi:hypothetical protein